MTGLFKRVAKRLTRAAGVVVQPTHDGPFAARPATAKRPVGQFESFLQDLAARGFSPRQIVDVGANEGEWSAHAHAAFPSAALTLIEPQIETQPQLERFCSATKSARLIVAGAGAAAGELKFNVSTDSTSSSFLFATQDGLNLRTVPVVTVDSLFDDRPLPDLMKIDVEGFELEVLRGATRVLGHAEVVAVEASFFEFRPMTPTFFEIVEYMNRFGFSVYDFTWFARRPSDGALALAEVVFARDGGALRQSKAW